MGKEIEFKIIYKNLEKKEENKKHTHGKIQLLNVVQFECYI